MPEVSQNCPGFKILKQEIDKILEGALVLSWGIELNYYGMSVRVKEDMRIEFYGSGLGGVFEIQPFAF